MDPSGESAEYYTSPEYQAYEEEMRIRQSTPEFKAAMERRAEANRQKLLSNITFLRQNISGWAEMLALTGAALFLASLTAGPGSAGSATLVGSAVALAMEGLAVGLYLFDKLLLVLEWYFGTQSPAAQRFIIESIKILDQRIQDREKILEGLQAEYDKETTNEGRESVQRRIDLAQGDLDKEKRERDALVKKVKDKSKIQE